MIVYLFKNLLGEQIRRREVRSNDKLKFKIPFVSPISDQCDFEFFDSMVYRDVSFDWIAITAEIAG